MSSSGVADILQSIAISILGLALIIHIRERPR